MEPMAKDSPTPHPQATPGFPPPPSRNAIGLVFNQASVEFQAKSCQKLLLVTLSYEIASTPILMKHCLKPVLALQDAAALLSQWSKDIFTLSILIPTPQQEVRLLLKCSDQQKGEASLNTAPALSL